VDKIEVIQQVFNAKFEGNYEPNFNISVGNKTLVLTDDKPQQLQLFQFGLTPFWAEKQMNLFNARAEGDSNKDNDTNFRGSKGIILKPEFRKPIRSQRCLIVASAFIEGLTNAVTPYLIYLKKRPIAFAGIWDSWKNPENEEIVNSFAIITVAANSFMQKVHCSRMPVILTEYYYKTWLKPGLNLGTITGLLEQYPANAMNAYTISNEIKNIENNYKKLLNPIGDRLNPENKIFDSRRINEYGYYGHKKKKTEDLHKPTLGDKANKD